MCKGNVKIVIQGSGQDGRVVSKICNILRKVCVSVYKKEEQIFREISVNRKSQPFSVKSVINDLFTFLVNINNSLMIVIVW